MTFLLNIFCSQCGGCYDEEKLISTSIKTYLIFLPTVPVLLTTDILYSSTFLSGYIWLELEPKPK